MSSQDALQSILTHSISIISSSSQSTSFPTPVPTPIESRVLSLHSHGSALRDELVRVQDEITVRRKLNAKGKEREIEGAQEGGVEEQVKRALDDKRMKLGELRGNQGVYRATVNALNLSSLVVLAYSPTPPLPAVQALFKTRDDLSCSLLNLRAATDKVTKERKEVRRKLLALNWKNAKYVQEIRDSKVSIEETLIRDMNPLQKKSYNKALQSHLTILSRHSIIRQVLSSIIIESGINWYVPWKDDHVTLALGESGPMDASRVRDLVVMSGEGIWDRDEEEDKEEESDEEEKFTKKMKR